MQNIIDTLEFKIKCLDYHYNKAVSLSQDLTENNYYKYISEFCSLMELLSSCLQISFDYAQKQSAVDVKAYKKAIGEQVFNELYYIQQFVEANRKENIFDVSDKLNIYIKSIPKRREKNTYEQRNILEYMKEVKLLGDRVMKDLKDIYTKGASHYDQSWREIEINRASFLCKECNYPVTKILKHIGNLREMSLKETERFVPRFNYVYGHELISAELLPWGGANEIKKNEVIVPIDNLYFDIRKESAPGCCGPDSSIYNVFCKNGHPVGKEAADCWMPHFIRFPLSKVVRSEVL